MVDLDFSLLIMAVGSIALTYWLLRHWIPDKILERIPFISGSFQSANRQPGVFYGCFYVGMAFFLAPIDGTLGNWSDSIGFAPVLLFGSGPVSAWIFLSAIPRLKSTYQSGQPINEEEEQQWLLHGFLVYILWLPVLFVLILVVVALYMMGILPERFY
tara:strand:+ start:392 stop:865 length:474 start_codon:yes stop_codon:yes gene_type:complete